ncbi:FecR family protein [Flavobacterium succinicans]|uniref:FecR family protein n=1 Tax=Flavobacterium succinicans TaxID=29536 RepID=A0A1I4TAS3_9FLAO|nr:FecR family protein [Flavobacterium succinicans]SFM73819.1 FecR family protein [Flavobacterium succinicans]
MQKRDFYTEIDDFLMDESFKLWVHNNQDNKNWEEWTLENPKRAKLVEESRLWILALKTNEQKLTREELQSALLSTWDKIEIKEKQKKGKRTFNIQHIKWTQLAASLLLFVFIGYSFYNLHLKNTASKIDNVLTKNIHDGIIVQINNSNKPQIITLSDKSSVLLQPNSKLSYPIHFTGNERKVYLSGEGFFEISKNPKKPFLVFANEIVTKVVGTSFRISAFENQPNIEVLVRTGKVKVKSQKNSTIKNEEITLLPNEAVRFTKKDATFNKVTNIIKDKSLFQSSTNIEQLSFEFNDIPVSQIFNTIEQAYQVKIVYPKQKLKDCFLTTSLSDEPLQEKLKIICNALGKNTSYEMNENQIIITTEGCN